MERRWRVLAALAPLVFLAALLLHPLLTILQVSLGDGGLHTALATLRETPWYLGRFTFSFLQAGLSTVLTLLVGLPVAYLLSVSDVPGRRTLRALVTAPFVLPPIVVAMALLALMGHQGWVNAVVTSLGFPPVPFVGTLAAILVAHVFYNVALVVRIVGSTWAHLDPSLGEAAATLGAGPVTRGRRVTLPLLAGPIAAASLLVFLFTFTSFGIIVILANEFQYYTVEAAIWSLTQAFQLDVAAVLAVFQMLFTLAVMTGYSYLQERGSHRLPLVREAHVRPLPGPGRWGFLAVGAFLALLVLAPLAALLVRSLQVGDGWGFAHYAAILQETGSLAFVDPRMALENSLLYASLTALVALPLGALAAWTLADREDPLGASLLDAGLMLPLGVSTVTLGLGLLLTYGREAVHVPVAMGLIVAAHVLIAYPFVTRITLAGVRSLPPGLREAATTLGAGPWQVARRVNLPLLAPSLAVAGVFAFAVSMGEFGATIMLRRPETGTLPVAIFESLGRPGGAFLGRALAMASVLMLVNVLAFLLIERLRPPRSEF